MKIENKWWLQVAFVCMIINGGLVFLKDNLSLKELLISILITIAATMLGYLLRVRDQIDQQKGIKRQFFGIDYGN